MDELSDDELHARIGAAATPLPGTPRILATERLHGGVSGLTYLVTLGTKEGPLETVVKVAPPGLPPRGNRDVLRHARLLKALGRLDTAPVPVPRIYFEDAGDPPLFAMSYESGECYEPTIDVSPDPPTAAQVRERSLASVSTLAAIHHIPLPDLGIAAEPVLRPAGELERWRRLAATAERPADLDRLGQRLQATVPEDVAPTLVHGDYRLGNLLFDDVRLRAVLDWEIWSVSDPRFDLAWVLMLTDPIYQYHSDRGDANLAAASGLPPVTELISTYESAAGRPMAQMTWFLAFARYKTAAISAALLKYNATRTIRDEKVESTIATLPSVIARGHALLDGTAQV